MQPLQTLLSFPIITRVLDGVPIGVGIECFESYIDADLFVRWLVYDASLSLYPKLDIVAISPVKNADSFDLLNGKGFDLLFGIANKSQTAYTTPISEDDVL